MIMLYLSGSLDSQGTAKLDDMHCIDEVYAFSDDDIQILCIPREKGLVSALQFISSEM